MVSIFSTGLSFIIFSQHLGNMMAALVTTIVSFDSNGSVLLYFGANHCRQGASCLWHEDGSQFFDQNRSLPHDSTGSLDVYWNFALHQPGAFDESLVVSGLNQADSKMQVTDASG